MSESRKTYAITFVKGLDKASNPFEADPSRATDEIKYVYRDGKVQKRHGYTEIAKVEPFHYIAVDPITGEDGSYSTNAVRWNGIWRFKAEDGENHIVAHIGRLLYEIAESDGRYYATPLKEDNTPHMHDGAEYYRCKEFEDYKSTAVIGGNSLWFFGGNAFVRIRCQKYSSMRATAVENATWAYVPTTTISITYDNAAVSGRQSLDQVNLMTDWRKNLLLGGIGYANDADMNSKGYVYTLDSPIVCGENTAKDQFKGMAGFHITIRYRRLEN